MAVSQAVARPVRTATQLAVSGTIIEFIDAVVYNLDDRAYAASVAMLAVLIGWVQVLIENRTGKGFLRKPEPPEKPVKPFEVAPDYEPRHLS